LLQLDVTSSQLLVTDRDFRDPSFGHQLRETVISLLDLKVIPVFNENDAISTRKAPYEVRFLLRKMTCTPKLQTFSCLSNVICARCLIDPTQYE
jgi:hypothetical protein